MPRDKTRDNRHTVELSKFHTDMRKNFFTVRLTEHWNRLHREEKSPSLERCMTHQDSFLLNSSCREPAFSRGLDSMITRGPFHPLQFCDSAIFYIHKWIYVFKKKNIAGSRNFPTLLVSLDSISKTYNLFVKINMKITQNNSISLW